MTQDELVQSLRHLQESRTLLSAIELDLFSHVSAQGSTAPEIAARAGTDARATAMLLNAVVSLGLLRKEGAAYHNSELAEQALSSRSPTCVRMALMHYNNMWNRWSSLTDSVRAGTAATYEPQDRRPSAVTEAFIAAMHLNASQRAPQVAAAAGADSARRMLDVGGGSGAYSIAFAQANPQLRATLFDLAPVVSIALRHIEQAGLADRIRVQGGDFLVDPFDTGYDLVFVSAICHMLGPEDNLELLRKCHGALAPGGRIVIQDFILDPDGTSPRQAALFSLNMLVATPGGASYTEDDYRGWLEQSGFSGIERKDLVGPGLMLAVR